MVDLAVRLRFLPMQRQLLFCIGISHPQEQLAEAFPSDFPILGRMLMWIFQNVYEILLNSNVIIPVFTCFVKIYVM